MCITSALHLYGDCGWSLIVTGNQLQRLTLALSRVVGVLLDMADDMDQVALLSLGGTLNQLAEQRHLVPVRVRHALVILLVVLAGGDVYLRHLYLAR